MIRRIISILNAAVTALPVNVRHAFVEVVDGVPMRHAGHGQFVPVIDDSAGGMSYWRANGAQRDTPLDPSAACGDAVRVFVPMALVAFVPREQCDAPDELLNTASNQLRAALRAVRDSMQGAFGVGVLDISKGVDVVRTTEIKGFAVPTSFVVLSLICTIQVDIATSCLDICGTPYDLVCAVIDKASNDKVVACLGPTRVDEICNSDYPTLCEAIQDSDPFEVTDCMPHDWSTAVMQQVMLWPETVPAGIVEAIGNADQTAGVRALLCDACPYDGIIQVDGVPVATFGPFDPCVDNTLVINLI